MELKTVGVVFFLFFKVNVDEQRQTFIDRLSMIGKAHLSLAKNFNLLM